MRPPTAHALDAINREFYRSRAAAFSATREAPWPGWERVLAATPGGPGAPLRVLDLGCGNGRLAPFLADRATAGLAYTGVDRSPELLAEARRRLPAATLRRLDLMEPERALRPLPERGYDLVAAFGLLHHLPGFERRTALLAAAGRRLAPGGLLAVSLWRFALFARFAPRRVTLEAWNRRSPTHLDPAELEPGDWLLRFGEAGDLRYCHFVDAPERARLLAALAAEGLRLREAFLADGREDALNEYLLFTAEPRA